MSRCNDSMQNGVALLTAAIVSFFSALVAMSGQGWFAALLFLAVGVALTVAALLSKS